MTREITTIKEKAIAFGVSENDLDISAQNVPVILKCKKCGVEHHMTFQEFLVRHREEGDLRCPICPRNPKLFFFKTNMHDVMMAGFNQERESKGISKGDMLTMLHHINHAFGERFSEQEKKKELPGK